MNPRTHWTDDLRSRDERTRQAAVAATAAPAPAVAALGVAVITADLGDGAYRVTQCGWDGTGWLALGAPGGFVEAEAADCRARGGAAVGTLVHWWTQPQLDGRTQLVLDVAPGLTVRSQAEAAGVAASDLAVVGDNGLHTEIVSAGPDGRVTLAVRIADGDATGGLLQWVADPQAPDGVGFWQPSQGSDGGQVYCSGYDGWWHEAHLHSLEVDNTALGAVSRLYLHANGPADPDGDGVIRLDAAATGDSPDRSVDLHIRHAARFATPQQVAVRSADGAAAVTLEFDAYGHFTGIA